MKNYKLFLLLVITVLILPSCADNSDYFQIEGIVKHKVNKSGECSEVKDTYSDQGTIDMSMYQKFYPLKNYNYILFLKLKNNMQSNENKDQFTNQISVRSADVVIEFGNEVVKKKLVTEFTIPGNQSKDMTYELNLSEPLQDIFKNKPDYNATTNTLDINTMMVKVKFNGVVNNDREISSNNFTYRIRTCFACLPVFGELEGNKCTHCHPTFQDLSLYCEKEGS